MKKTSTQKPKPPPSKESAPHSNPTSKVQTLNPGNNIVSSGQNRDLISPLKVVSRKLTELHLNDILNKSSDIILTLAKDQTIQTINPAGCQMLGYSLDEIIGKNWFSAFVSPSMRASAKKSFENLFKGEALSTGYLVLPIIGRHEEEKLVEWEGLVLQNRDNSFDGIILIGRDITAQKMVEKELIQSEWDMALAQKIARLGSWVYHPGTDEIRMSGEMCRIFESPPQTSRIRYKDFLKLIHPEDRESVDQSHEESLATGKGHQIEYRVPLKNGREKIIYEVSRVFLDDLDNPLKMRGIVQDITERKSVEEALRYSERELSMAQKIGKMGNWVFDIEKDDLWWSNEVYRIFGLSSDAFRPSYNDFLDRVHPEDRDLVASTHTNMLKGQRSYSMDHRIHLPDQSVRTVHLEGQMFYNDHGEPQKIRGVIQDITERKQSEEKLKIYQEQLLHAEKLSSIGKLSASIAHEINNPLFGIRNVLERTKMCLPLKEQDERFIDMAISETDRIAKLVRRLNGFFNPGREQKVSIQINHLLEEVVLLVRQESKDRNISLLTEYCQNLPQMMAVPDQIKQIALNLIQNAMDAVPANGGEIVVSTDHQESNILLKFKDNGGGMDQKTRENIFEPFFTTKSDEDGTGLGLWVTQGLVQSHGGTIEVDSELGRGTVFFIKLPLL